MPETLFFSAFNTIVTALSYVCRRALRPGCCSASMRCRGDCTTSRRTFQLSISKKSCAKIAKLLENLEATTFSKGDHLQLCNLDLKILVFRTTDRVTIRPDESIRSFCSSLFEITVRTPTRRLRVDFRATVTNEVTIEPHNHCMPKAIRESATEAV